MPSLVTGIIGGIQGASASHNAANAQRTGYGQAAGTVNGAVNDANPIISGAAGAAGAGVSGAAGAAGAGVSTAAGNAGAQATGVAGTANQILSPYADNGTTASNRLSNLTSAGFSFNPSDLANTPGYQFQLAQGLLATDRGAAARGQLGSGGAAASEGAYAQGLAGTTYNQQFQNAIQTYGANVNSLLPQAQMGMAAAGQQGGNLINAAQYAGNTGLQGAEYSGTAGMQGAEYAGNAGMAGANSVASNLINAGVYTGNTQIGAGNATANGDVGAANAWNGMLGSIGQAGNAVLGAGLGAFGGPSPGSLSIGNLGTGLTNMYGVGSYGGMSPAQSAAALPYGVPSSIPMPNGVLTGVSNYGGM